MVVPTVKLGLVHFGPKVYKEISKSKSAGSLLVHFFLHLIHLSILYYIIIYILNIIKYNIN